MNQPDSDHVFAGSVPQLYERYLVPLIFEPSAIDLAARTERHASSRVLEIAAGTGAVTRHLARLLGPQVNIVATDLNPAMLDHAASVGTRKPVSWQMADAMQLPFVDQEFDTVVCQFGAMFFPDKARAFAEARRVLRPGGMLLFNVWDHIRYNEFADTVTDALAPMFAQDPPRFLTRTPHGYHDVSDITRDLINGGWNNAPQIDTPTKRSRATNADDVAVAYCQGTPLRNEIEARDATRLTEATDVASAALTSRFGSGAIDGRIQAHVISVRR